MGGKNSFVRTLGRDIGNTASNINKEGDKIYDGMERFAQGAVDNASGETDRKKKKSDQLNAIEGEKQRTATAAASAAASAAETDRIEKERMAGGSTSRTLLTGPAGLEDEEENITRRTLAGRR